MNDNYTGPTVKPKFEFGKPKYKKCPKQTKTLSDEIISYLEMTETLSDEDSCSDSDGSESTESSHSTSISESECLGNVETNQPKFNSVFFFSSLEWSLFVSFSVTICNSFLCFCFSLIFHSLILTLEKNKLKTKQNAEKNARWLSHIWLCASPVFANSFWISIVGSMLILRSAQRLTFLQKILKR